MNVLPRPLSISTPGLFHMYIHLIRVAISSIFDDLKVNVYLSHNMAKDCYCRVELWATM